MIMYAYCDPMNLYYNLLRIHPCPSKAPASSVPWLSPPPLLRSDRRMPPALPPGSASDVASPEASRTVLRGGVMVLNGDSLWI